ncbi:MAG: hypothetical protein R2857_13080 [Vampirovibrionales bacterium]
MAHLNHPGQEGALLAMTGGLIVAEVAIVTRCCGNRPASAS